MPGTVSVSSGDVLRHGNRRPDWTVDLVDTGINTFTGGRIDIGRRAEVLDERQRLIRTNHIAFTEDAGDANTTVSRKHAHIVYSAASGDYRLKDDGSAHGTAVIRDGHTIPVPQGTRGTRLQSGDEIVLGEAKLRVRIGG